MECRTLGIWLQGFNDSIPELFCFDAEKKKCLAQGLDLLIADSGRLSRGSESRTCTWA